MRKIASAIGAAALLLFAGSFVWKADATTGAGTLGLARAAKDYSPIDTVACRFDGFCRPGYTMVWCADCSTAGAPAVAISIDEASRPASAAPQVSREAAA